MRDAGDAFAFATEALGEDEVQLLLLDLDSRDEAPLWPCLSADEKERARRFVREEDRHRFVTARGALRHVLAGQVGAGPEELRFVLGPHGKPGLPGRPLRFNLAHSGGLALLALSRRLELGVDIERERPLPDADDIASRFFAPEEARVLKGLPEGSRNAAFFRCWTCKEALVKATGDGLSLPLDAFCVDFADDRPARLLRLEGEAGPAARWFLTSFVPARGFAAALAAPGRPSFVRSFGFGEPWEGRDGSRRVGGSHDVQGRGEPRGAVLDLARGEGQRPRVA